MSAVRFCAVVPAAGGGVRMGGDVAKIYLPLAGRTVIEWALDALLGHPGLERLVVALADTDRRFERLPIARDRRVTTVTGADSRAGSVAAGLAALADLPGERPVLVHDGARPCLTGAEVERLLGWSHEAEGALLAVPVRDTLKRETSGGRVARTEDRTGLWQALTPQMFPRAALADALAGPHDAGITDEASAMERAGCAPRLVEGDPANIKITRPHDLPLAEAVLAQREVE